MTALNLCTSVFTGGESVLQYYLVCQTCSTADDRVAVCLNCAAICHDQHEKHSLTRGKIFCGCLQSTHSCSACSLDELAHALSSGDKRKRSRDGAASSRFLVWTQLDQDSKTVASSHLTAEEAGSSALLQFVENNPWKYASLDELRERGKVTETRDANGSLSLVATGEDGTQWRAGVDLLENTAAGSGGSGQKSAKRKRLRAEPGETSSLLSGGESSSASHAPTKRAKNAPNKPTGDGQSAAVAADAATGRDAHPDGQKNTPKRPLASFMLYLNTTREQVLAENPNIGLPDLSRLIGSMWKGLTASEKAPYEERSRQDRLRYQREMDELRNAKQEERRSGEEEGSSSSTAMDLITPVRSSALQIIAAAKAGSRVPHMMSGLVGRSHWQAVRPKEEAKTEETEKESPEERDRGGGDSGAPVVPEGHES